MSTAPAAAKHWTKAKFRVTYPIITTGPTPNSTTAANNTMTLDTLTQLMAHFLAHHQQQTQQPPTREIMEKPEDMYGMSTTELDSMLVMCSLPSGAYDSLPSWLKKVNKKH
eukprot:3355852-Ditylum_brightwellii.AAC.1